MQTIIVIPAYNEGRVIGEVVEEVRKRYPHVFVIDDGSADDTAARARAAGAVTFRHAVNRGQGAALQTGITAALRAGADLIVTYDADGQMRPEDIDAVIAPVAAGACAVALGSRFLGAGEGMPPLRRATLEAARAFTNLVTGLSLTDTHNGFRALSREAASKIRLRCDRMAHASELLEEIATHALPYREVPVVVRYTEYSMRKGQKLTGAFRILRDLFISSWTR